MATSSDDEFQPAAAEPDKDAQIAALQQQVRTLKLEQQAQEFGVGDEVEIAKHKNAGKVGTVVKVDEESYIIRNISGDDIKVRKGNVVAAGETAAGV